MSLKMCALASGSKGNCTFVSDGETNILIDLGIPATRAENCLRVLGADPDSVHIFITHSHSDHIGGLKVFVRRHPSAVVHCQKESAAAVFSHTGVRPTVDGRSAFAGAVEMIAVPVPHDVPCFGYVAKKTGRSIAVVTDVGAVDSRILGTLCDCNMIMLEANHDISMLRENRSYTPELKARIMSPHGHLSNIDCAAACEYLAQNGVKNFILAHLSQENNDPSVALSEVNTCLDRAGITGVRVVAAAQDKPTGLFEIC